MEWGEKPMNKVERYKLANELIILIATSGRKFFNHEEHGGSISAFTIRKGRLYFIDGYTYKRIYAYGDRFFRRKFTEGGTMQALILDMAEWIRTGKPTNAKNGYGGVYCDYWGYPPSDMAKIQRKAQEIGFSLGLDEDLDRREYIIE
ncbi:hypothetical protein [Enterococcus songbeiensis]|uniref:hypothetical protein n=1 Tax=Enterococcus songbeiensis TaxID=2559927 RepID=UPI0010F5DADC|nr:hypothetical protein [Enterococcus songbeiensis]